MTKKCTKCGQTKPVAEFGNKKACKDGKRSQCKLCVSQYKREYSKAHSEKKREENRRYREAHPEKFRETDRKYREANREKCQECDRKSYRKRREADPEKFREKARKYLEANREKCLEYNRKSAEKHREQKRESDRKRQHNRNRTRQFLAILASIDAMKQFTAEINQNKQA